VLTRTGLHVLPDGIEHVERDVESDFSRKTFDGDEYSVGEPQPANESQGKQRVTRWRLVQVQDQSRVEHLHVAMTTYGRQGYVQQSGRFTQPDLQHYSSV